MKASAGNSYGSRSELLRGAAAMVVGAALAYGSVYLFALFKDEPPPATPQPITAIPISITSARPKAIEPPAPGEDPWWRGDAAFWEEQARLNSAAVAPQYRELQFAWSEKMAATARLRSLQNPTGNGSLAMPANEAQTTELHLPDNARR